MEAGLPIELAPAAAVDRLTGDPAPIRAAAVRVIARTRAAWATPVPDARATPAPDVSDPRPARPRLELKASRALDNQPRTGD